MSSRAFRPRRWPGLVVRVELWRTRIKIALRRLRLAVRRLVPQREPRDESLGNLGEKLAASFLRRKGMKIVARQVRLALGEIDLIAVDGRTIVFVEVKTRRSHVAGHPLEAITVDKQQRLTRLALAYLRRNHLLECAARFDVIAVTIDESLRDPDIRHVENAFEPREPFQMFG